MGELASMMLMLMVTWTMDSIKDVASCKCSFVDGAPCRGLNDTGERRVDWWAARGCSSSTN